MSGDECLI